MVMFFKKFNLMRKMRGLNNKKKSLFVMKYYLTFLIMLDFNFVWMKIFFDVYLDLLFILLLNIFRKMIW